MARPKKRVPIPPRPEPAALLDDVPADDPAERDRLAAMLPRVSDRDALDRDLVHVSRWLHMQLYERGRFDAIAVRATLVDAQKKLEAALAALVGLGYDAAKALHNRAETQKARPRGDTGESLWQWLECEGERPSGLERVRWIERALTDAVRWTAEAAVGTDVPRVIVDPPDPDEPDARPRRRGGGRPRGWDAEAAMGDLIQLWEQQTGAIPTLITDPATGQKRGPFLKFCEAVIPPIYDARGIEPPSMPTLAQKLLYPSRLKEGD